MILTSPEQFGIMSIWNYLILKRLPNMESERAEVGRVDEKRGV